MLDYIIFASHINQKNKAWCYFGKHTLTSFYHSQNALYFGYNKQWQNRIRLSAGWYENEISGMAKGTAGAAETGNEYEQGAAGANK
jgi:hypothetical protein